MCYFQHAVIEAPYYPIVYLRGYAGTQGEIARKRPASSPSSRTAARTRRRKPCSFLFGDTRVLVEMADVEVALPRGVAEAAAGKAEVGVAYHIDTVFGVRGLPVELNRRAYSEGSAIFRTYEQLTGERTKLFTAFLMRGARVVRRRRSSGFALRVEIRVPDYDAGGRAGDYYEGGLLFVDKLNVEVARAADGRDRVKYGWDSSTPNRTPRVLALESDGDALVGRMPFGAQRRIRGNIRVTVTGWNAAPNGDG